MKNKLISLFSVIALLTILLGCEADTTIPVSADYQLEKESPSQSFEKSSSKSTLNKELALTRASTAKYHNIQKALADGYEDIDLYIPQMGWHFLNPGYLDENFEIDKPELLVYTDKPGGGYRLVAVEYAVPLALSTNAPEGFTGDSDVWNENTGAGLWTLHAWVWLHNPNGIFADFNPQVP